jgi:hypothetical protein
MEEINSWDYRGHKCEIQIEIERGPNGPENEKAWHLVTKPDGTRVFADISPYDTSMESVEIWVDLGYPGRRTTDTGSCNWDLDSLRTERDRVIGEATSPVEVAKGSLVFHDTYEITYRDRRGNVQYARRQATSKKDAALSLCGGQLDKAAQRVIRVRMIKNHNVS